MEPGTRVRVLCPKCLGGDTGEQSLSLYRDHSKKIAWKCFRAKCGYKGNQLARSSVSSTDSTQKPLYFTKPFVQCTWETHEGSFIRDRFDIPLVDCYWCAGLGRFALAVRAPNGHLRGYVAYSFTADKKSINYRERVDEPFIHYTYRDSATTHAVIVEDWFSAAKVYGAGMCGIALMGTTLNRDRIDEIRAATKGLTVILALDNDAQGKAVKYVLEYGGEFNPPMRVARLAKDLKYESAANIKKVLIHGDGNFIARGNDRGSIRI